MVVLYIDCNMINFDNIIIIYYIYNTYVHTYVCCLAKNATYGTARNSRDL